MKRTRVMPSARPRPAPASRASAAGMPPPRSCRLPSLAANQPKSVTPVGKQKRTPSASSAADTSLPPHIGTSLMPASELRKKVADRFLKRAFDFCSHFCKADWRILKGKAGAIERVMAKLDLEAETAKKSRREDRLPAIAEVKGVMEACRMMCIFGKERSTDLNTIRHKFFHYLRTMNHYLLAYSPKFSKNGAVLMLHPDLRKYLVASHVGAWGQLN